MPVTSVFNFRFQVKGVFPGVLSAREISLQIASYCSYVKHSKKEKYIKNCSIVQVKYKWITLPPQACIFRQVNVLN